MNASRFMRICVLGCLSVLGSAWGYEALERPTEMLYWDPSQAYNNCGT